jgi:hypothetical protein
MMPLWDIYNDAIMGHKPRRETNELGEERDQGARGRETKELGEERPRS